MYRFKTSSKHKLVNILSGQTGYLVSQYVSDGVVYFNIDFEGYGSVCSIRADEFEELPDE